MLNDNILTKKHLKSDTLSKVDSKLMDISHGALCGSQQIGKLICSNFRLKHYVPLLLTVVRRNLVQKDCLKMLKLKINLH